jgi:hypothetical protein
MSNVGADNVFTYVEPGDGTRVPTAAVWGADQVIGGGRLAILMDINWLEPAYHDATTEPQVAQNLALFLSSLTTPPPPTPGQAQVRPATRASGQTPPRSAAR